MSLSPSTFGDPQQRRNAKLKYVDLSQKLMRTMVRKGLQAGEKLGTEQELSEEYGLSRVTVRQALAILEEDGFIYRKQKKGTFVKRAPSSAGDLQRIRGTILVAIENNMDLDPIESTAEFMLFRSLERELATQGFSVRVVGLGADVEQDRMRLLHAVEDADVEGVCAIGPGLERYRSVLADLPLVSTATFHPTPGAWAGVSMQETTRVCVDHLIQRGHREIAVLCGAWIDDPGLMEFVRGFEAACKQHGLPFYRERVYRACEGESLPDLARQVLTARIRPTGVFTEGWRGCNAVLAAAAGLGLQIPRQLSLIGSGQNVLNIKVPLPVTTYVTDNEQLGQKVGRMLADLIDGAAKHDGPVWFSGELIDQGSVGQPAQARA